MAENQSEKNIEIDNSVVNTAGENKGTSIQNNTFNTNNTNNYYGQPKSETPSQPSPKISPEELREDICQFLDEVEEDFKYLKLFHNPHEKIILQSQYIPIQVTLERRYKHDIESLRSYTESEVEFKQIYAFKRGREEEIEETKKEQVDWQEANKEHQKIMVLADPGMGKSTLLRREALITAQTEKEKLRSPLAPLEKGGNQFAVLLENGGRKTSKVDEIILPVFLRLSELVKQAETSDDLLNLIPVILKQKYPRTFPKIEAFFQDKLAKGQCLLLLDALDEVPKNSRLDLRKKLNSWLKSYPCKLICTSRIVGYDGGFINDAKEVEIVPFTHQQTETYIKNWFINAASYLEDDSVSPEGLITELANKPQIEGLSQNPLLLSLLCSLYQTKGLILPAKRGKIYQQAVNYLLGKWSHQRESLALYGEGRVKAKARLLEVIAYHFSQEGQDVFSGRELADQIEIYLQQNPQETVWRNMDSDRLISELCEEDGIIVKLFPESDYYLFLHRTFQEYFTPSYLKRKIEENPSQGLALAKRYFFRYDWHETLSLLGGLLKNPIPLLEVITKEKNDIFGTLLILAGLCISECETQTHPLMNKIIKKIFRLWHSYPNAGYLQSILIALGNIGNAEAVSGLISALNDSDSYVKERTAEVLVKIGNPEVVSALIAALKHSNCEVRWRAAEALEKIGNPSAVSALIALLNDSDSYVRLRAVIALKEIGNTEAVSALIASLNDSSWKVRWMSARALGEMGNSEAVSALIVALKDPCIEVIREAASALTKIGNPREVRFLVAEAFGKIDNSSGVSCIKKAIENLKRRSAEVETLENVFNPEEVLAVLIAALKDSDSEVRYKAACALGEIGNLEAVSALISVLNDSEWIVRRNAAEALANIDDLEILKKFINNWTINIYDPDIFLLARKLAVRYSQENLPFIPVYPHLVRFSYSPILTTLIRFKSWIEYKIRSSL